METPTKTERERRLTRALRAAQNLANAAEDTRDWLNPEWDGPHVIALAEKAEEAAQDLLRAINILKAVADTGLDVEVKS